MKPCIGCGKPSTTAFCEACDAAVTATLDSTPALVIGTRKSAREALGK
jgi:hypothetical protein